MIALLLLAIAGWTSILTRGEGPWRLVARLRDAWPQGPLGCPLCCGTWVGIAFAGLVLAVKLADSDRASLAAWVCLVLVTGAGVGALVSEAYARAVELVGELSYLARQRSDASEAHSPARGQVP